MERRPQSRRLREVRDVERRMALEEKARATLLHDGEQHSRMTPARPHTHHELERMLQRYREARSLGAATVRATLVALFFFALAACTWDAAATGWRGTDVHLVDNTWIGTETPCHEHAEEMTCRVVLEAAVQALTPALRSKVTAALLADLPTTYVTATGEQREARVRQGLDTRTAIVLDLADGTRRVVGLWCYVPRTEGGEVVVEAVFCRNGDLSHWRDGNAPHHFRRASFLTEGGASPGVSGRSPY